MCAMTTQPIKIAVLLPSLHVGGAERLVLEELSFLRGDPRFSFEVHLVFEEGLFFNNLSLLGLPIHVWHAPHKSVNMLKSYFDIVRYLRKSRTTILHSHLLDSIGPIIGRMAGAKVVATVHNDKKYGITERFVLGKSDLVLGCGTQVLRNIREFIPLEKVNVLSNAIHKIDSMDFHREDVFEQFGIKEGSRLIVSLGSLSRQKGFDMLVKAFRLVIEDLHDTVLLIGGDGEERNHLEALVKSEGLEEHVKLPGVIRDINKVLASCDVYVNSSRWEGLPMTLLEAIAHGKPMIATDVGGNAEVVKDNVTGILVPAENPDKLASALISMLKNKPLRERMGNEALALFLRDYTIDKHCEALAEYYLQVVQSKHKNYDNIALEIPHEHQ
jgi:glycosyltransferase involved in cell wall biosynthesis